MDKCPEGTLPEDTIELIAAQKYGVLESLNTTDTSLIQTIIDKLKDIFTDKPEMFRDGVDQIVIYSGMNGAIATEFIDGCAKYFYQMDPDMYELLIQSIGKGV